MTGIGEFTSAEGRRRYEAAYEKAMALCPTPVEKVDVDTRHGTTRIHRFGDAREGPPIVLLSALMSTSAGYWQLLPTLSERHTVYAVDTLGEAGASVQTTPLVDIPDRARCLDEALAGAGLTDVHVVGVSTGGWHAANLAVHAPERVASLSLLEPTTLTVGFSRGTIAFGALLAVVRTDWTLRRFLRWSAGADIIDRADTRLVLAGIRDYRPRVPFQFPPGDDAIRSITAPVLAVFGARSVVQDSVRAAERLRALLPDADVDVLPDAGHDLFRDPVERERILHRVLGFTDRHPAPGAGGRPAADQGRADGAASTSASRSTTPPGGRSS